MLIEFKELPDWKFDIDKVSAGVYKITGVNYQRKNVEAIGTDPDALRIESKQAALQIIENDVGVN